MAAADRFGCDREAYEEIVFYSLQSYLEGEEKLPEEAVTVDTLSEVPVKPFSDAEAIAERTITLSNDTLNAVAERVSVEDTRTEYLHIYCGYNSVLYIFQYAEQPGEEQPGEISITGLEITRPGSNPITVNMDADSDIWKNAGCVFAVDGSLRMETRCMC